MKLAIAGGTPVRSKAFPPHLTTGSEEKDAVCRVIDSGVLSKYLGSWHDQFMGGDEVRALESEWARHCGNKHAIAVNSASSGLICALGAAGVGPGDEVIVTPWSMSISATAPLFYGATPVFADIESDCFCIDPDDFERKITAATKAVIVVDLFGQPYDARRINEIAARHGIVVIEDAAQAPGAMLSGKPAGRLGDIGVFSLNYHKHIQCGEGGVVVTDNDTLAERLCLIRNHAESVVEGKGVNNLVNMIGFNMRMTELEAAVARCQLAKLKGLLAKRLENVAYLESGLRDIPCLTMPAVRHGASHAYYVHASLYDADEAGVPATRFVEALRTELPVFRLREKEGSKLGCGYVKPIYRLPAFQKKIAFGESGWPFPVNSNYADSNCPVCEQLHNGGLVTHEFMLPCMEKDDLDDVITAFHKVWELRHDL